MHTIRSNILSFLAIALSFFISGCAPTFKDAFYTGNPSLNTLSSTSASNLNRDCSTNNKPGYKDGSYVVPPLIKQATPDADSKTWSPTPCQAFIVQAAVNHCITKTRTSMFWVVTGEGTLLGAGAAATVVGAAVSSPPGWIAGLATVIATMGTNLLKLVGSSTQPGNQAMYISAGYYAQFNQNMELTNNHDRINYYAGLWNAAGLACPNNLLLPDFKMEDIPLDF
jgi:hypothetical protein